MNNPYPVVHPIMLAPMAGYTDKVFRSLCHDFGCDLAFTEMISANGLQYGNLRTEEYLQLGDHEQQVGVQLFGHDPEILSASASNVCSKLDGRICCIDINMGCPVPKVTSNGDGSALMNKPELAQKIVYAVKKASRVPVTVKIRKGYEADDNLAPSFARAMEEAGADAITIHPRTKAQMYSGKAEWEVIGAVKKTVSIPVVGNGDVCDSSSAMQMFMQTGCDGIMIARGALGNPWIFKEIKCAMNHTPFSPPTDRERFELAYRHAELIYGEKGERGLVELRKHLPFYIKGTPDAKEIRSRISSARSLREIRDLLLDR